MPFHLKLSEETKDHKKQTSLKRRGIAAGFALLMVLLVGNTLLQRNQLNVQIANQASVVHTREVLYELERTESLLANAEAGERGFLYTGDPKYLNPYDLALVQVGLHIDNLAKLTDDNPRQNARIATLRDLARARLADLGQTVSLYASDRREEAKALVLSDAGPIAMNNIRNLVGLMMREEALLDTSRSLALRDSTRVAFNSLYLASLAKFVVLIVMAFLIFREITYREKYLEEIWSREEWYRVTLDSIGDAVICTDAKGNVTLINLVAERLTGWRLSEALGRPMDRIFQIVDASTREVIANPMDKAFQLDRTGYLPLDCILIRRDGNETFIEDSAAPIHSRDGSITGAVIVFRDVSLQRALSEKLTHSAQHDSLTGLPNRVLLNDRVGQAITLARRRKGMVAVLFLDLDGFKHINDSLGHMMGDKLLQSVAERLKDCVRSPDTVSRQGGDEFVVLLQDLSQPDDAARTAGRLLKAVAAAHPIDQHEIYVTTSIGISLYPQDGQDAETLFKNADSAMYEAKKNGRQSYRFFGENSGVPTEDRYSIEQGLRHALEQNEFTLYYQPKIDLKSGAITGAEALLRWTHPTLGKVPPEQFIPVAEDSGLILPIGAWVIHQACMQASAWAKQGLCCRTMAVNVSAVQFMADSFLKGLFADLEETGLDPKSLELEMTESVLMSHPELTGPILKTLREYGVRVSVDDFGTGYSSLSYLQQFSLDALKIDRSFVHKIGDSANDATIVSSIISMGQSLNLRVIAEGVETAADVTFLKTQHCDEAQGYFFSYPVPAEPFACLLQVH